MQCQDCGSTKIKASLSRLEKIGMNVSELLLDRCEQQKDRIKELEEELKEARASKEDKE